MSAQIGDVSISPIITDEINDNKPLLVRRTTRVKPKEIKEEGKQFYHHHLFLVLCFYPSYFDIYDLFLGLLIHFHENHFIYFLAEQLVQKEGQEVGAVQYSTYLAQS